MTDKEIIKALEVCSSGGECLNCAYNSESCEVNRDALDIINRQQTEIERLKNLINDNCEACACNLLDERDKKHIAEIELLKGGAE